MHQTMGHYYVGKTGNHQRLIIEEATGRNVAVVYDEKDAPALAAAPELLAAAVFHLGYEDGLSAWDTSHPSGLTYGESWLQEAYDLGLTAGQYKGAAIRGAAVAAPPGSIHRPGYVRAAIAKAKGGN